MLRTITLTIAALLACSEAAQAGCSSARPAVVRLTGVLERITFAGPPDYESVAKGDAPETYFVLRLTNAVCVDDPAAGRVSAKQLQLFLEPSQYARYRRYIGRRMTLSGVLWPAETGHHHTPLMFTPAKDQLRR